MYSENGNSSNMYHFKMERVQSLYAAGRHQEAIDVLKEVLGQSPNDAEAHALLALNLLECGRIVSAEFEVQLALQSQPNEAFFHWVKGRIYLLKNQPKQTLLCAQECLALDPSFANAHLLKYAAFLYLGELDKALGAVDEAAKIEPTDIDVGIAYVRIYLAKGAIVKAEAFCLEVLQEDAGHEHANVLMGSIKLMQGDTEDAEYHAKFVIINNPNSTEALELLASIKLKKNKLIGAWWWFNSKLAHMSQLKTTTILVGAYVFFITLSQIVRDFGYTAASQIIVYSWIGLAVYSWVGIPAYYRALKKELSQFQFNKNF